MPSALAYRVLAPFLLIMSLSVKAHDNAAKSDTASDEEALLFSEVPSVFTASRHEQPVTKAPASVDIITADQIKRYGWRTVAAMLGSLPGFLSTFDRAYNHVGVRGIEPPGDYNTRILVMIDGHRVNENLQDYAGLGQDFLVDMANIERVEVVRGPASALYGSSAFFAVVNVITQRGRDIQGTKLAADVASYDSHQGQISHGKKYANGLETLFSASYLEDSGHTSLTFPGLGTAHNSDGEQVERLYGKLAWGDFTLSGGFMGRKKYLPTGETHTSFGDNGTFFHDRRAYADLNFHHHFDHDWELTGRLFWDNYQFDDALPYLAGSSRIINQDQWQGQWLGSEALLSHTFFEKHRVTLGSEYRRNYQQLMTNQDVNPYMSYANNQLSSTIYGLYLQDEWTLLNNLHFQAGGRYDHYDSFGGTFNPRLGLVYEPVTGTNLKLLYGNAFRAPNAFESFYTCCQAGWIGNPNLRPEQIETYEFVLEQRLHEYFDLRISPYYNRLQNLIGLVLSPTGISQFQNYANADAHGVETQLKGHFEELEGRLSYTYQQSSIIGGVHNNPNSPTHMVKLNLTAPLLPEKLFAGLEVQYVSQRATVDGSAASGYTLTNFNLHSRHWLPGVELTGGIYNVFNVYYVDPASPPLSPNVITQDGRNFRVRISFEF